MNIGSQLKALRKEKRMSLKELSQKSKVAEATLSRMEHGAMTGTLQSHMSICRALGVSLTDFYRKIENEKKSVFLMREKEKRDMFVYEKRSTLEFLTTKVMDKGMMPVLLRIAQGGETHKEENKTGSEKFIYVLSGNLTVKIDKEDYHLNRHDSLYFDASLPHSFKNNGSGDVTAMCVLTPPEF